MKLKLTSYVIILNFYVNFYLECHNYDLIIFIIMTYQSVTFVVKMGFHSFATHEIFSGSPPENLSK